MQGTFWLTANDLPTVPDGGDDAFWERIKVIKFESIPKEKRILDYADKCKEEKAGIAKLLVDGAIDYIRLRDADSCHDGLQCPEAVLLANKEYKNASDLFSDFLEDCIEQRKGRIANPDLYNLYQGYHKKHSSKPPMDQESLTARMKKSGFTQYVDSGTRFWKGMQFKAGIQIQ